MKNRCKSGGCNARCLRYLVMGLVGIVAAGVVVTVLWNWLLPGLFGWQEIGFLQAIGLLLLSKILFGHFHCRPGMHGRCHAPSELANLSPEEREKLQAGLNCCGGKAAEGETKAK